MESRALAISMSGVRCPMSDVQPSLAFGELWLGKPNSHAKAASP
jgi:hypothetical protein